MIALSVELIREDPLVTRQKALANHGGVGRSAVRSVVSQVVPVRDPHLPRRLQAATHRRHHVEEALRLGLLGVRLRLQQRRGGAAGAEAEADGGGREGGGREGGG